MEIKPVNNNPYEFQFEHGKHAGKMLVDVPLDYIAWCSDNWKSPASKEMFSIFLKDKNYVAAEKKEKPLVRQDAKDIVFNFGKYKGQTIEQVGAMDFNYLNWCGENLKNPWMQSRVREYMLSLRS